MDLAKLTALVMMCLPGPSPNVNVCMNVNVVRHDISQVFILLLAKCISY